MNSAIILLVSPFLGFIVWVFIRELLYNSEKLSSKFKHRFLRIHDDLDYNYFKQVNIHPEFTVRECSMCKQKQTVRISKKIQKENKEFIDFLKTHNILEDFLTFMDKKNKLF